MVKNKNSRVFSGTVIILTVFAMLIVANILSLTFLPVYAGNSVSQSDAVSATDNPSVNRINVVEHPLRPMASGMLTHVTSSGASITVAQLFQELNLQSDASKVKGITCNSRYFDVDTGTGGARVINTLRSFDTLEMLSFEFEDGTSLPVIFKDGLYVTNLTPLCTDMSILINGKTFSSNSQETYDETIPVSGKKYYDLSINFAELPDMQFSDFEQLQFKLPDGFTLPDNFNDLNHTFTINMGLGGKLKDNKIFYDKTTNKVLVEWYRDDATAFNNFRGSSTAKFTLVLSGNLNPNFGKLIFPTDKIISLKQENLHNATFEETGNTVRIVGDSDPSDNEAFAWVSGIEFSDIEKMSSRPKT